MIERLTLISHFGATWAMLGVILVIQIVHYPLFSSVGASSFERYEALHTQRITWVVAPLMIAELITAIMLVARPPSSVSATLLWTGLALLAAIWLSTAFVQVPLHRELASGFEATAHRKLLATNWVRTIAWLLRAAVTAVMMLQYVRKPTLGA